MQRRYIWERLTVLGTLTPDTADEATTLIPSLASKMDSDTLQPILDELTKMRMWEKFADQGNE
jgi:DNA-directed RNA polymerase II subunit RPB4